jgi:antitoxin FitA
MAQLIVRDLPEVLVQALRRRAARNQRSAEEEHRQILRAALQSTRRRSFAQLLAAMPNVGEDDDFARAGEDGREADFG